MNQQNQFFNNDTSSINTIPQKTIDQQILELKQQYGNPFCSYKTDMYSMYCYSPIIGNQFHENYPFIVEIEFIDNISLIYCNEIENRIQFLKCNESPFILKIREHCWTKENINIPSNDYQNQNYNQIQQIERMKLYLLTDQYYQILANEYLSNIKFRPERVYTGLQLVDLMETTLNYLSRYSIVYDNFSIVTQRKESSPFPTIVITPWSFFLALQQVDMNIEEVSISNKNNMMFNMLNLMQIIWKGREDVEGKLWNKIESEFQRTQFQSNKYYLLIDFIKTKTEEYQYLTKESGYLTTNEFNIFDLKLQQLISNGRHSIVYRAFFLGESNNNKLNTIPIAVKETQKAFIDKLRREYTILKWCNCDHIVKVYGMQYANESIAMNLLNESNKEINVNQNQDLRNYCETFFNNKSLETAYISLEYCNGGNLVDFITNYYKNYNQHLDCYTIKHLCEEIRISQKYFHEIGFIHRDIKLSNFLVCVIDDQKSFTVKCCDFGESRSINQFMMTLSGDPMFQEPEKIRGGVYSEKSDLYSIGYVYYFILCGFVYQLNEQENCNDVEFPHYVNVEDEFESLRNLIVNLLQGEKGIMTWEHYFNWQF